MESASSTHRPRITPVRREEERVMPLELFFDLVFVLAITQCTTLMAAHTTWSGLAQGALVLAVLWWSWGGYAWLTSVVDPEEGAVRIVIFAAMAAFLVVALCVPEAFGDLGLTFAVAYAFVRGAHIALFMVASRDDPGLRTSVSYLAVSTAIGVGLLVAASFLDGTAQGALWALAVVLDYGGPGIFGTEGWRLVPRHFAERYGLIVIIALGESIVAIGIGAGFDITAGVIAAAVLGVTLAAMMWWAYFDVVAQLTTRRLVRATPGREQNTMARDVFSYLHLVMVIGIILVALGLKKTLAHVDDPLHSVAAFALYGGVAFYLLAHVAIRLRNIRSLNGRRLGLAIVLLALVPLAAVVPALAALAAVTVAMCALITVETISYGEARARVRHADLDPMAEQASEPVATSAD